ncbi:jerky protein homolog [Hippopotamus amphibius kiboko]|uniref:jerky protein homolog n=1 Tax=Hippopotamus amphibius kiboko TaxID=575201 RepID=UPI0025935C2B|nr:jerky protein homolog [Hippopotamus amphibius kiboko]XP_057591362.1 jerky protein homolog [Hippopotamus amphibius kiboko]XP_057591363.1 jerky protein homolog [Hippopotamus amphibius kiboko]XP_057591364.1 jerky protein homolog [Hippopotamus amphibius kiboko]
MASKPAAGRSPGEKRKRVVLTLKEKMDICRRLETGESRKALMQEYNVGMSTLYDIRAHKARLLRFFASSDSDKALAHRRTLHTPKLEHLDRVLYEWFLVKRAEGVPVSGPMLIEKAKDFYEQMQLTEPCVFSGGWLWRFKARHGIKKLDTSSEKQAADQQAAEQFCGFFQSLTAEHGLSPEQVYNADETGLFWRCAPSPSPEGGPMPGPKQNKDRLTVLLCANATGSHRIRPLVVGKCGGPKAVQGTQHLSVAYKAQGHAWVDKEMLTDWFHHIFVPAVKEHFRAVALPEGSKAILLLDGSRAHPREAELVSENMFTIFLPASVTALVQPMDQGIRRDFMRNFVTPSGTLQAFAPRCSVHDAVLDVACAWNAVPGAVFSRAWRRLWPKVTLVEGSSSEEEPELLRTKPPDQAFAHIPGLAGGAPARLGSTTAGSLEPAEAEEGDEEAWEQAAASFDAVVRFAEGQPCFSAQEVGHLRALRSVFGRRWQARRRAAPGAAVKLEAPWERSGPRGARPHSPLPGSSTAGEA